MGVKEGLLFVVLAISWAYVDARSLVTSEVMVMQINYQEPLREIETFEVDTRNERLCSLCEQFTSQAIYYLGENKTQTEIIDTLHQACYRLHSFQQQCHVLVDYYAPLFFLEIAMVNPGDFCKKVNLCEAMELVLPQKYPDSCTLCQHAISEVLTKLKDPDTQLEIIELLLKGCDSVENYAKECKKLVFEYGPLILMNAEQFLETKDVCVSIHACKASGNEESGVKASRGNILKLILKLPA
eukprot:TRINITY_DN6781_c0_g1_i1.p1 TRINITY_DN6781_c0_g1~~TRINITY_DN6781_c0_g1_i1.p1  ORF type:complete len:241 (-),score=40.66 TRINITY_DN6781_c0_g1_i1:468-1190(-)